MSSPENPISGKGVHGMAVNPKGGYPDHSSTRTEANVLHPPIPFPETAKRFGDARDEVFHQPARTTPIERPRIWDKETPKESLIQRLINNLALRLVLAGTALAGTGIAVNETYQNIPAVRQSTDNVLERVGLKAIVPPTFDNKAEATVLGRNNSFYITPEEYKEKGPPTVEGNRVSIPFFIRFNDGKEHIINVKRHSSANEAWDISGDIKGGELLVPFPEDGEISIGGGTGGMPYLYKPGMSFSGWSISDVKVVDGKGRELGVHIEAGALQTSKDLNLQQVIRTVPGTDRKTLTNSSKGPVKGFASIGTLLDDKPIFIFSTAITPENKFHGAYTDISTTPTGQAYVLK